MNYSVTINEETREIMVMLSDGTCGKSKCNPTDKFDIGTGIELALERAKVSQREANKPKEKPMGVMELVKALEKALPKGQCVVVGNGTELTKSHKAWLHSMTDCDSEARYNKGYDDGYAEGYDDGYADGLANGCECECECCDTNEDMSVLAMRMIERINEILGE